MVLDATLPAWPLRVHDVTLKYGSRVVLDRVHFSVEPEESRVILGGSGCGKSTLLRHIVGLLPAVSGRTFLMGTDVYDADESEREALFRRVGMVFQGGALLNSMTVLDNVALPLFERARALESNMQVSRRSSSRSVNELKNNVICEIAEIKLAQVGLWDARFSYPPELSGGMKKRAAVARAMALDPEVLFCDEPTAGLDPQTSRALDELLLKLRDEFSMTLIVVTHELSSIQTIAEKVLMLESGGVVFDGTLADAESSEEPSVQSFFHRSTHRKAEQRQNIYDLIMGRGEN